MPWEKRGPLLNVEETQWVSPLQRIQMSRDEDVALRATISYQLQAIDAHLAVTKVKNWENSLHDLFEATIQTVGTMFSPEDLLVWQRSLRSSRTGSGMSGSAAETFENGLRWESINNYLFQQMRDKVALWGVQVNWVRVRDIALTPHGSPTLDTSDPIIRSQARPVDSGTARGATASATPMEASMSAKRPEQPRPSPNPIQQEQMQATPSPLLGKIKDEDLDKILPKVYKEVQEGRITDPDTIRGIAQQFAAIANDPQKNKLVTFDAARASQNLFDQADRNEQDYNSSVAMYNDATKTDWMFKEPHDDNKLGGG
jgi:hypothetical protein